MKGRIRKVTFWKVSQEEIKRSEEIELLEAFPQPSINGPLI